MAHLPLSASVAAIRASVFADLAPRIDAFTARGGTLFPFHIGDTHLAPPDAAQFHHEGRAHREREGDARGDAALYRYGPLGGTLELLEACAARLRATRRGYPEATRAHVLVTAGATHALFCAARTLLDPGDEVLVASPYWPLSVGVFHACAAQPVEVPLTARLWADPRLDAGEVFAAACTSRTRAIYLITPNNPDGKVLAKDHLAAIARVAEAHGLWVIADEVYADYTYGPPHVSMAALQGMAERTVTLYSFSKSHALAGARVGMLVGPERVIAAARRVATHTVFNVPVIAQRAAERALASGDAWMDDARDEYRLARDTAAATLARSGARFSVPEGGSYLFVDFAELLAGRSPRALLERAIDHGVLLAPGDAFGAGFEACARLCFTGVPRDALDAGLARLDEALTSFGRG